MTPEQDFKILASEAYQVDVQKSGEPWITGDILENKNLSHSYEVLKVEDNTTNGMQAMAVAPVKNRKICKTVVNRKNKNKPNTEEIQKDKHSTGNGTKAKAVSREKDGKGDLCEFVFSCEGKNDKDALDITSAIIRMPSTS